MALVGLAFGVLGGVAQAKEVPSHLTWTNYGSDLAAVSCWQPGSCVAVGQGGAVLRSPNTDAAPLAWTFVDLKDPAHPDDVVDFADVSCSDTSCLAISAPANPSPDLASAVLRSTDGGATWTRATLPAQAPHTTAFASAITCAPGPATASTRVCYVVGIQGDIWRSADDGQSWSAVPTPASAGTTTGLSHVACASAQACVAVGGDNLPVSVLIEGTQVTVLKTPTGIMRRWTAVACDTPTRCLGTGGVGGYSIFSTASQTWATAKAFRTNPELSKLTVKVLACPIAGSCVGLTGDGLALHTDDPDAAKPNWQRRPVPDIIGALGCVTSTCVGVGKSASWFASFDLGGSFRRVNQVAKFDAIQCTAALSPTCVAGGEQNVGVSRTGGELWTLPLADRGALNTQVVRCSAPSSCVVFGQFEGLATTDLDVWRPRFGAVSSALGVSAQSCVTDTLCVGVNESVVYTTFDGGQTQWSSNQFPKVRASAIACVPDHANPVTCFVPDKDLLLIGTMTQDATGLPHWNWRYTNADADQIIAAVACSPDGSQCTAAGADGMVLTTVPGSLNDWTEQQIPATVPVGKARPAYTSVACPAAGFCLVGGAQDKVSVVASTTDNWADYSLDQIGDIRASPVLKGFGCESVDRCVAVGSTALVGVRNPPVTP